MKLLTQQEIDRSLKGLPLEWAVVSGAQLEISIKFENFSDALAYVNEIGVIAEQLNHHPDINLGYGKVELVVTTHSLGGLTSKDFEFAKAIEKNTG